MIVLRDEGDRANGLGDCQNEVEKAIKDGIQGFGLSSRW